MRSHELDVIFFFQGALLAPSSCWQNVAQPTDFPLESEEGNELIWIFPSTQQQKKKSWSPLLSTLTQFKEKSFNKCPHIAHQSSSSFSILYSCLLREQSNYMKSVFKTRKESWERCKSLTWPQTHRDLPVSRIPSAYPMFLLPPCSVLMELTLSIWNSFHNCNLT